jgi:hypothetical protein
MTLVRPAFWPSGCLALVVATSVALPARAADAPAVTGKAAPPGHRWAPEAQVLEPRAVAILKAASERLAGARTLGFTAIIADEAPSRLGPPLLYASRAASAPTI